MITARAAVSSLPNLPVGTGSFHLATVMFLRARQLRDGAAPRVESRGHRHTQIAVAEVMARLISWEHGDA